MLQDNGVKLVDPMGLMLTENWEPHATHVANCSDLELVDTLQRVAAEEQIDAKQKVNVIIIGYDTRYILQFVAVIWLYFCFIYVLCCGILFVCTFNELSAFFASLLLLIW